MKYPGIFTLLLSVLLFLQGCDNNKGDAVTYRRLDTQLQTACKTIDLATEDAGQLLDQKTQKRHGLDSMQQKRYSVMLDVNAKAAEITELISQVRLSVIKETPDPYSAGKDISRKYLLDNGLAKKLWQEFSQLRILVDSLTFHLLPGDNTLRLQTDSIKTEEAFIQGYFEDVSAGKALVNLSILQHDAAETGYFATKFTTFLFGENAISFSMLEGDIGITQNIRQAKPGEPVKITIDVRDFTIRSQPEVFVNHTRVENKNGMATIELKAVGTGLQSVPVVVHAFRKDGMPDSIVKTILYKVRESVRP